MATYTPPIPKEFFALSYVLLAAATVWSLGALLSSSWLANKKVDTKAGRPYRAWQVGTAALIVGFGIFCISKVYSIQIGRELSEMNGVLEPANAPDPPGPCNKDHPSALKLYFGGMSAVTEGEGFVMIALPPPKSNEDYDPVLLGIDRLSDGNVALHANIFDRDGKPIARIDGNHFEISRNRLLDPLSPPRKDRSTIVLTDEEGNTLQVRFVNKHSISFQGKLYVRSGTYVRIDKRGLFLMPNNNSMEGPFCINFLNKKDKAIFWQIGK